MNNDNLGYLLQHVATMLARQSDQVLQEQLGIGFAQFKILMLLGQEDAHQQREIAVRLGIIVTVYYHKHLLIITYAKPRHGVSYGGAVPFH